MGSSFYKRLSNHVAGSKELLAGARNPLVGHDASLKPLTCGPRGVPATAGAKKLIV